MILTAYKLDGARVVGYQSSHVALHKLPGRWRRLRRRGYFVRVEVR